MYRTHPKNIGKVKAYINGVETELEDFVVRIQKDPMVIPDPDVSEGFIKLALPPDEKFVEWEESDLEWMIPLGMAVEHKYITYKVSRGVMNVGGEFRPGVWQDEHFRDQ